MQVSSKLPSQEFYGLLDEAESSDGVIVTVGIKTYLEAIFRCPKAPVWFELEETARPNEDFVDYVRNNLGLSEFAVRVGGERYSGLNKVSREEILKMNEKIRFNCILSHLTFMKYVCEKIPSDRKVTDPNSILRMKTPVFEYHLKLFERYVKEPWFSKKNIADLVSRRDKVRIIRSKVKRSKDVNKAAIQIFSKGCSKKYFSSLVIS